MTLMLQVSKNINIKYNITQVILKKEDISNWTIVQ